MTLTKFSLLKPDHRMHALILLITTSLSAVAHAQSPPLAGEPSKTLTGTWEISNADRDKTCAVTFRSEATSKGGTVATAASRLDLDRNCPTAFPFIKDAVAWNIGAKDAVRLIDSRGGPLLELFEVESGMYEGERRGEGIFFMQSVTLNKPARTVEQVAGDWNVTRGGTRAICIMTLSNTGTGEDGFAVTLKAGCDRLVTQFNPNSWRLDKGELVLSSDKGDTWRFEEADEPSSWRRIPERAGRIQLVRK
jgi:hypothetical protein